MFPLCPLDDIRFQSNEVYFEFEIAVCQSISAIFRSNPFVSKYHLGKGFRRLLDLRTITKIFLRNLFIR